LREVAVKVLAVQACSFFRNGRGARGGRRACISGGGGETLAGKTGSEASSLQTRFFQRLCGRRKQKQVFTIRDQRSQKDTVHRVSAPPAGNHTNAGGVPTALTGLACELAQQHFRG